jgi:hypothetical protein
MVLAQAVYWNPWARRKMPVVSTSRLSRFHLHLIVRTGGTPFRPFVVGTQAGSSLCLLLRVWFLFQLLDPAHDVC